jgi:branched-chain amino acid transport system substrate-binding protein
MRHALLTAGIVFCACPKLSTGQNKGLPTIEAKADTSADEALSKAIGVLETRNKTEGLEALLKVRKEFPESTAGQEALFRAGVLTFQNGEYQKSREYLDALLYENPLFAKANEARLKTGLAAVELTAFRDAEQILNPLVEKLEGEDKRLAQAGLARAQLGTKGFSELLRTGVARVESQTGGDRKQALKELEDILESRSQFLALVEVWHELPTSHPAWPLLTSKLSRVYYHLRDWTRLEETLRSLIAQAPDSAYVPDAKQLLARVSRRAAVKPKVIGAVLPMSGKFKPFGEAAQRGIELALKGSDIELLVRDGQGEAALTAKLIEELVFEEGAMAIIGPMLTDDTKRAALVAEELQVPLVTLSSRAEGVTKVGAHVFRTMVTNAQQAETLAAYAMGDRGFKNFAILYPNTSFGVEFTNAFWDAIEKRGGTVRGVENYNADQKSFSEEAKKLVGKFYLEERGDWGESAREIREQGLDNFKRRKAIDKARQNVAPLVDFEALLIPDSWERVSLIAPALAVEDVVTNGCDSKDMERIRKTTGKGNLKTVTLLGPSAWSSPKGQSNTPQLIERGGKYVACSVYVDPFFEGSERPSTKNFVAAFREAHRNSTITLIDAVGFDTASMMRAIIEKNQPKTRAAFREALQDIKFDGVTGTVSFDDAREAQRQLYLLNVGTQSIREVSRKPEG